MESAPLGIDCNDIFSQDVAILPDDEIFIPFDLV